MLLRANNQRFRIFGNALAVLFLALAQAWAHSEPSMDFQIFPMPGGAPLASVNGLAEDVDGAVWVITWGEGVHRIHGTEWKTFTEEDGLPDDWGRAICMARDGGAWVGTGQGLALIRDDIVYPVLPDDPDLVHGHDIVSIHELSDGRLVVAATGGWAYTREPGGTLPNDINVGWSVVATPAELQNGDLLDLVEVEQGVWLAGLSNVGALWYRDGQWVPDDTVTARQSFHIYDYEVDGRREIWLLEWGSGQCLVWENDAWMPIDQGPTGINQLARTASGAFYAATQAGLFVRDATGWNQCELDSVMGVPEVSCVAVTRDGAVWAGGREGLMRGTLPTWVPLNQSDPPSVILPRSADTDPLLAMNFSGTVFEPDGTRWRPLFRLEPWEEAKWKLDDSVWMGDGRIWIASDGSLRWTMVANGQLYTIFHDVMSVYSLGDGQRTEVKTLPPTERYVERFLVTSSGDLLYIDEECVSRLEDGAWTPFPVATGYEPQYAYFVQETEPEVFWAGVTNGLERWTRSGVTHFDDDDGLRSEDSIHAVCRTNQGEYWFASMGSGVYHYDGTKFRQYTKSEGLQSNSVRKIFVSSRGTVWIANRGTGISALRGDRWVHYTMDHGLPHATTLSISESRDGTIWAGFQGQGIYRFRPEREPPDTRVLVGPDQVDSHGIGVFSFVGRDAWNQTPIRDLQYSWRIVSDGGDSLDAWSAYSPETTVATLSPETGNYYFEVRASDENGNVDAAPASVPFVVLPPLWMKPVFYLPVSFSILLAGVALLFQWISRNALLRSETALRNEVEVRKRTEALLARHSDNLEELVEERTRDLAQVQEELIRKERLATLGQLTATVSHELRNPLGTIQSSLYTIDKRIRGKGLNLESALDRMARSVKRCDRIIDELLDFTRSSELTPLTAEVDLWLKEALDDIGAPENVEIELELNCPAFVRIDFELMRRVLINVLDNAVQAMDEHPGPQRTIAVRSHLIDGRAEISIEDNGPGISQDVLERIFEPLYSTKNFGIGLGTNIIRNIMLRHHGGIEYANREGSRGARILIWLPATEITR